MEHLSPSMRLINTMRSSIEEGMPVRFAIQELIEDGTLLNCSAKGLLMDSVSNSSNLNLDFLTRNKLSPLHLAILETLNKGLKGQPIHAQLLELEQEAMDQLEAEIEKFNKSLPTKLIFPMMFLLFPAIVLVALSGLLETISQLTNM